MTFLINMDTILLMSTKIVVLGLLKTFLKKGFNVITFVHDVTGKILSRDSNNIVDVVMSPKLQREKLERSSPTLPPEWG